MFYGKHPITLLLQAAGYVIQRFSFAQKDFQRIAFGHCASRSLVRTRVMGQCSRVMSSIWFIFLFLTLLYK